jgi:hypothetical protein
MDVGQLKESDANAFQELRLLGLKESPSAFGSSFEDERERTVDEVQAHLGASGERVFFGAVQGSEREQPARA